MNTKRYINSYYNTISRYVQMIIVFGSLFIVFILSFFVAINDFRSKRLIEDIPTSKIRTGAIGTLVEIRGKILLHERKPLLAPISGKPCSFYKIEISYNPGGEDYDKGWFFYAPGFFLIDQSDCVAFVAMNDFTDVRWKGSPHKLELSLESFGQMPTQLKNVLRQKKKENVMRSFSLDRAKAKGTYVFTEFTFEPEDTIYILGYSRSALISDKALNPASLFEIIFQGRKYYSELNPGGLFPLRFRSVKTVVQDWATLLENAYEKQWLHQVILKTKMVFGYKQGPKIIGSLNPIVSNFSDEKVARSFRNTSLLSIAICAITAFGMIIMILNALGHIPVVTIEK